MPMPGDWTMSMAWMRMPGQSWPAAALGFLAMWVLMMAAMMLPSLASMLARYRRGLRRYGASRTGAATALAGAGYLCAWAVFGALVYPLGLLLASAEMRSAALARLVPLATGAVVLLAGVLQLTPWKARRLWECRDPLACCGPASDGPRGAFRHGLRLGLRCSLCCAGLIAVLLVSGVMDLRVMALVTAAITAERLAPWPARVARATGLLLVALGVVEVARAAWSVAG
jgi:predicted metal-binding membrane protein